MSSQAAKRNRFAERVRAVEDFETEVVATVPPNIKAPRLEATTTQSQNRQAVPTKNKTIELRLDTIDTLKNAVNWQKLVGEAPQTEKEVIESALAQWFSKHGYPRKA